MINIRDNIKFIYAISDGFQLLEHCLALHEWLGGEFYVTPRKKDVVNWLETYKYPVSIVPVEDILKLSDDNNKVIIIPSGSHGYVDLLKHKHSFFISHGISEKNLYLKSKRKDDGKGKLFPLQFARYLRGTYEYSLDYHKNFLGIDSSKKTLLYAPTQGSFTSISMNIIDKLIKLKSNYNVIVKPHALCWELNKKEIDYISKNFPINIELHNIVPFLDLMDIYIGDISAATSAATFYNKKPIVLLKKDSYNLKSELLMKEDSVISVTPEEIEGAITEAISESNSLDNSLKSTMREKYFSTWYGEVNGTEGYKFAKYILNKSNISYEEV